MTRCRREALSSETCKLEDKKAGGCGRGVYVGVCVRENVVVCSSLGVYMWSSSSRNSMQQNRETETEIREIIPFLPGDQHSAAIRRNYDQMSMPLFRRFSFVLIVEGSASVCVNGLR